MLSIYTGTNTTAKPQVSVSDLIEIARQEQGVASEGSNSVFIVGSPTSSDITISSDIVFNSSSALYVMAYQVSIQ